MMRRVIAKGLGVNLDFPLEVGRGVGVSPQTRSFRSSGFSRSRSASKLLLTQKTELSRLTTVCYRILPHPCQWYIWG